MREKLLLGVSAGALVGALVSLGGVGCSDSTATADAATPDDAASDSTVQPDSALDAGKDVSDAPRPCLTDANLSTYSAPDAVVTDAGLNMAVCVTCLRDKCKSTIDSCQALCECREVVTDALDCLGNGNGVVTCSAGLLGGNVSAATQNIGLGLVQCIQKDCPAQCPLDGLAIPDAGTGDAAPPKDAAPTLDGAPTTDAATATDAKAD